MMICYNLIKVVNCKPDHGETVGGRQPCCGLMVQRPPNGRGEPGRAGSVQGWWPLCEAGQRAGSWGELDKLDGGKEGLQCCLPLLLLKHVLLFVACRHELARGVRCY
jgi:hypothetical protein